MTSPVQSGRNQECLECSHALPAPARAPCATPQQQIQALLLPVTQRSGVSRAESPGHLYLKESADPSPALRARKNQGGHRGCKSKAFGNKEGKYCGEATMLVSQFLYILHKKKKIPFSF